MSATFDTITAIGTGLGAVVALYAAWDSHQSGKRSEIAARQAEALLKKQGLADLWSAFEALTYLTDEQKARLQTKEVGDVVHLNASRMEKIAFFWEADLVDRGVLELELGEGFALLYEQIDGLGEIPSLRRSGRELLAENPFAPKLYQALRRRFPAAGSAPSRPSPSPPS